MKIDLTVSHELDLKTAKGEVVHVTTIATSYPYEHTIPVIYNGERRVWNIKRKTIVESNAVVNPVELYLKGWKIRDICKHCIFTPKTFYKILRERGIELPVIDQYELVARCVQLGVRQRTLVKATGLHRQTVVDFYDLVPLLPINLHAIKDELDKIEFGKLMRGA